MYNSRVQSDEKISIFSSLSISFHFIFDSFPVTLSIYCPQAQHEKKILHEILFKSRDSAFYSIANKIKSKIRFNCEKKPFNIENSFLPFDMVGVEWMDDAS